MGTPWRLKIAKMRPKMVKMRAKMFKMRPKMVKMRPKMPKMRAKMTKKRPEMAKMRPKIAKPKKTNGFSTFFWFARGPQVILTCEQLTETRQWGGVRGGVNPSPRTGEWGLITEGLHASRHRASADLVKR